MQQRPRLPIDRDVGPYLDHTLVVGASIDSSKELLSLVTVSTKGVSGLSSEEKVTGMVIGRIGVGKNRFLK